MVLEIYVLSDDGNPLFIKNCALASSSNLLQIIPISSFTKCDGSDSLIVFKLC